MGDLYFFAEVLIIARAPTAAKFFPSKAAIARFIVV
jgi:hypothetical protein